MIKHTVKNKKQKMQNTSSNNAAARVDRSVKGKKRSVAGTVVSAMSISNTLYFICKDEDGNIIGSITEGLSNDKVTFFESLIPCDTPFSETGKNESDFIGLKVDVIFVGNDPVYARVQESFTKIPSIRNPFGIDKKDILMARSMSDTYDIDEDGIQYLESLGYDKDVLRALNDAKLSEIDYNGNVLNIGDFDRYGVSHKDDIKSEVSLPESIVKNVAAPPSGKLKKKSCYSSPVVFSGR